MRMCWVEISIGTETDEYAAEPRRRSRTKMAAELLKYWNSLPNEIKCNSITVLHFKSKISIAISPSSTDFMVFNKFSGFYGSMLSQLRLGLSIIIIIIIIIITSFALKI